MLKEALFMACTKSNDEGKAAAKAALLLFTVFLGTISV